MLFKPREASAEDLVGSMALFSRQMALMQGKMLDSLNLQHLKFLIDLLQ